jgi:hypothetical protein
MTNIAELSKDERERLWSERMEITIGGVEVHGRSVQRRGDRDPGIEIKYAPVFQGTGIHEWIEDLSRWLSELCHDTVMRMDDEQARARLLYRLVVTRRLAEDESHAIWITDFIDPEFERVDPEVVKRAAKIRGERERYLNSN